MILRNTLNENLVCVTQKNLTSLSLVSSLSEPIDTLRAAWQRFWSSVLHCTIQRMNMRFNFEVEQRVFANGL